MSKKMIIGMLHLGDLLGDLDVVVEKALFDINALQKGGIDGILIENWKEKSVGETVSVETAKNMAVVAEKLVNDIKVPFGFNVLNNDYKVAFGLAKQFGAAFVELDVFVDMVRSKFVSNLEAKAHPFVIDPKPSEIISCATVPLWSFVQPKHYEMLDKGKTIEKSTQQAIEAGVAAVIVTKATGVSPTLELVKRVKKVAGETPVGIGSGLNEQNAQELLQVADFAIVGTYFKINGMVDNPVDVNRVIKLMKKARQEL